MGALEALRDTETGQEASRAASVLGAMAGQGTREAMADRGAWVAKVDPGTQEAMAERGAWEASMGGSPPKKNYWGDSSSPGGSLEAWSLRALGSRTEPAGAQESRTEPAGALESRTEPAGALESRTEPAGALESWTGPARAPETERSAWAPGTERNAWAPGTERTLSHVGARVPLTDGTSGDEDELDGTSGDEAELDGTSGDEDKLGGASGDTRGLVPTRDRKLPRHR